LIKGAPGEETNFSLDVQYNKKLTNTIGQVSNIIIRSFYTRYGVLDDHMHYYLANSNAISVFTVGQTQAKNDATFTSKATLKEIFFNDDGTLSGYVESIEGNVKLQVSMTDGGDGINDKIGITLYRKDGGLWFSNNWNGTKTELQNLKHGNIYVSTSGLKGPGEQDPAIRKAELGIKAYPNPFVDHVYFDLQLLTDSKVRLEIYNIDGAKLATIYDDVVIGFNKYRIEYTPENFSTGMLIYKLIVDGKLMFTGKLVHF